MKIKDLKPELRNLAFDNQYNEKNISDGNELLTIAFNWKNSKEGYNFWGTIYNEFYNEQLINFYKEKPKQYNIGIDTFERAKANLTKEELLACCRFNIDKYTWRKKDQDKSDFEKIIAYANYAIENGF